jgi:DNA-binding beta-propeller fold protein YncE
MARNNYFTGKLLVERDFTDEQRYFMGKDRRHNQRLHGWGSVCGLKVKQHDNPHCRDKYVVVEPGMAVDCCGREILVDGEQIIPFREQLQEWWRAQHGPETRPDDRRHLLQFYIRYRECPAEQVPVLFDECPGDETAHEPNRIVESFEFGVLVDPKIDPDDPTGIELKWQHTINLDHAHRVAVDEESQRVYVLTGASPSRLYVYRAGNYSLIDAHPLPGRGLDLALSPDGTRAYVAIEQYDPMVLSVLVLDTSKLGSPGAVVHQLPLQCPANGDVRLAVSPSDGRLYVLNTEARQVFAWASSINLPTTSRKDALLGSVIVGEQPWGIVVSPDGAQVFVANSGSQSISVIQAANLAVSTIDLPHEFPYALAVAESPARPKLFVADRAKKTVRIIDIPPGAPGRCKPIGQTYSLAPYTPIDLVASAGGRWIYMLLEDEHGKGLVQVVDAYRLEAGETPVLGHAVPIGDAPRDLAHATRGWRLYAAFEGRSNAEGYGGVAVIQALEEPCAAIFHRALEACPGCPDGEYIVLATVEDYVFGQEIVDTRLDNLADRHLLPSVGLLTDVVQCMLDSGVGAAGRGEPGPPGPAGKSGEKGDPGKPGLGLKPDLAHICAINWPHGDYADPELLRRQGLLIAFDRPVRLGDIHRHSFLLLVEQWNSDSPVSCWCEARAERVKGLRLIVDEQTCEIRGIDPDPCEDADDLVNGAQFIPIASLSAGEYRVMLKGDLIRDDQCRGLDADHLPPWLPERHTGDWVEGGTFESWFIIGPLGENQPGEGRVKSK